MPRNVIKAHGFEVEIEDTSIRKRYSKQMYGRAVNKALRVVAIDYSNRLFKGFKAQGVDPRSARTGYWPKLKIPAGITRKGGRTKRGKILKKSGAYLKSAQPKAAIIKITGSADKKKVTINYPGLPKYAKYHEQQGNKKGFTTQIATAQQAAFLRSIGFFGAHEGSIIKLPARRVFVYPPSWKGVSTRIFKRELAKLWS